MVIVDDAAVAADGDVGAGFFEVGVAGFGDFDDGGGLAATDAFLFAGDADGAAADADFYEVCAGFGEEAEAFAVDYVTGANFDFVAVFFANESEHAFLPFAITFAGVDAEDVCAGCDEGWDALFVVVGIDAGADEVALVFVGQAVGIGSFGVVIAVEDESCELLFAVDDGEDFDFIFPEDVAGFWERDAVFGTD